ncbi:hypothetical protein PG996_003329 [Apiospora saccharicola]|uniref:Uncharacterized protein n=1 Tax=Apiospora saccharicola TaxID=335842 RepID=A0ABR1W0Z3_9PEZI
MSPGIYLRMAMMMRSSRTRTVLISASTNESLAAGWAVKGVVLLLFWRASSSSSSLGLDDKEILIEHPETPGWRSVRANGFRKRDLGQGRGARRQSGDVPGCRDQGLHAGLRALGVNGSRALCFDMAF